VIAVHKKQWPCLTGLQGINTRFVFGNFVGVFGHKEIFFLPYVPHFIMVTYDPRTPSVNQSYNFRRLLQAKQWISFHQNIYATSSTKEHGYMKPLQVNIVDGESELQLSTFAADKTKDILSFGFNRVVYTRDAPLARTRRRVDCVKIICVNF
jgi:hypothetical protein